MKKINSLYLLAFVMLSITLNSCTVIGGIFKTGVGVGVFIVIAIIVIIGLIIGSRKK